MDVKEIISLEKRDYAEEKRILKNISNILKLEMSKAEITKRLEENGFNGVYLVDGQTYSQLSMNDEDKKYGCYFIEDKLIVLNKDEYKPEFGVHEMGHAILNNRCNKVVYLDSKEINYGAGLEEGAMSVLMASKSIDKLSSGYPNSYVRQALLFRQLNELYVKNKNFQYRNLLVHLLKQPETFLPTIRDIFSDIYITTYYQYDNLAITKSAFYNVLGADLFTRSKNDLIELLKYLFGLNGIYACLQDEKLRIKRSDEDPFRIANECRISNEEKLMSVLFGTSTYEERQKELIDSVLYCLQSEVEYFEEDSEGYNLTR